MVGIIESISNIYRNHSHRTSDYYGICDATAKVTSIIVVASIVTFPFITSMAIIFGIAECVIKNRRQPLLHFYLPFIHEYGNNWIFGLVNFYNLFVLMISVIASAPTDLTFFVIAANARLAPKIVHQEMDKLSAKLERDDAGPGEIKQIFVNFMRIHQKFNE